MKKAKGFTLVELLVGSTILLVVIIITLTLYMRSNKLAVDQQQFTEIQHDVRSAMYFLSRDAQNAGVGLGTQISGYYMEGTDAHGPAPESADSLKIIGNFDQALNITIESITGVNAQLADGTLANLPYDCPEDLENKTVLIVSNSCPGCFVFRYIDTGRVNGCEGGNEVIQFLPSSGSGLNPPGGLKDTNCDNDCWDGATMTFGEIRYFWLDTSGNPYVSFTGTPTGAHQVYRRPTIANATGAATDDNHRRFLLETTATVRNLSLSLYSTGNR